MAYQPLEAENKCSSEYVLVLASAQPNVQAVHLSHTSCRGVRKPFKASVLLIPPPPLYSRDTSGQGRFCTIFRSYSRGAQVSPTSNIKSYCYFSSEIDKSLKEKASWNHCLRASWYLGFYGKEWEKADGSFGTIFILFIFTISKSPSSLSDLQNASAQGRRDNFCPLECFDLLFLIVM